MPRALSKFISYYVVPYRSTNRIIFPSAGQWAAALDLKFLELTSGDTDITGATKYVEVGIWAILLFRNMNPTVWKMSCAKCTLSNGSLHCPTHIMHIWYNKESKFKFAVIILETFRATGVPSLAKWRLQADVRRRRSDRHQTGRGHCQDLQEEHGGAQGMGTRDQKMVLFHFVAAKHE